MRPPARLRLPGRFRGAASPFVSFVSFGAAGAAALCICCAGAGPSAARPGQPLAPYTGRATELFDDLIEPAAVGYQGADPGARPTADPKLRERTQTGDAVVRARVVTITSDPE